MKKNQHPFLLMAIVAMLFTAISNKVSAQSPVKFGIGIEGGIPVGDASDAYSAGAGISFNVRVPLPVTNLDVIGSVGYQQWFWKSDVKKGVEALFNESISNPGILPIRVGARYGFGVSPLYIKFDLGPAIVVKEPTNESDNGTFMSYSPGVGAKFGPFETELKYDIYSKSGDSNSFFGLKLSYYFN